VGAGVQHTRIYFYSSLVGSHRTHAFSRFFTTQAASNALTKANETYTVDKQASPRPRNNFVSDREFYGLGIKTQDQALFVEYPTDPDVDYEVFKGRAYEAVAVLSSMCFVFFALGYRMFVVGGDLEIAVGGDVWVIPNVGGCGGFGWWVMFPVLVAATVYRAMRVPGSIPGDYGYHSIIGSDCGLGEQWCGL
jgi:hypothetical protein